MGFGRLGFRLIWILAGALTAQVVPGWFVVELTEAPAGRVRGVRRIRDAQNAVRAQIATRMRGRVEVKESTEVAMNSLIVRSDAEMAELAALPGVRRVWPVYQLNKELDRAVGLMQISKAWEMAGGADRAGAGMKIAILDTGLDLRHPAFQTESMTAPPEYPRATNDAIRGMLNGKVIVYRTYDQILDYPETVEDFSGHGTGVAMAAAGLKAKSRLGEIQGVAPGAWLGIYRIWVGPKSITTNTAIAIKAIDDAIFDGMDVINISFGFLPQLRPEQDPMAPAIDRAAAMGVMVVKSVGNSGPARLSGSNPSPGVAGIAVGASWADRLFASGIRVNGGEPYFAIPGDGPAPEERIQATLKDVATVDPTGLACSGLPPDTLTGAIALILRGECTFEEKLNAAQGAGAIGAVVYSSAGSPDAAPMAAGSSTLPAVMIRHRDGLSVKAILAEKPDSVGEIGFDDSLPFTVDADGASGFSSRGPGPDGSIRPDLLAVGEDILLATQKTYPDGELYDASGFIVSVGTSFSAPIVAGAYAVLKAARPGLTLADYRTLLVNSAQRFPATGRTEGVQTGGAGRLDLAAALAGQLATDPISVSFGIGGQTVNSARSIRVRHIGQRSGTWKVTVDSPDEMKLIVTPSEFSMGPGDTVDLEARIQGELQPGEYQGAIVLQPVDAADAERPHRIAYWYAVPTGRPASISALPSPRATARPGEEVALTFLITDAVGGATPAEPPQVSVLEGSGAVVGVESADSIYPGYWLVVVRVGAAAGETNRFRIQAGPLVREVSIRTQ